jgi:cbb3-type cytochrome oxidase subunit 3
MVDSGRRRPRVRQRPIVDHSLTRAQQDNSEVITMAATIYLLILVAAFIGIVIWVFGRKRKARFEADARIPLDDNKGNQS